MVFDPTEHEIEMERLREANETLKRNEKYAVPPGARKDVVIDSPGQTMTAKCAHPTLIRVSDDGDYECEFCGKIHQTLISIRIPREE